MKDENVVDLEITVSCSDFQMEFVAVSAHIWDKAYPIAINSRDQLSTRVEFKSRDIVF